MPIIHSVISEADTHVYLPAITQMAHHLVRSLNLTQYIQDNIHIETGWTTPKGTRANHSFRSRTNFFRVIASQNPIHNAAFEFLNFTHTGGNTFYPGQLDVAYNPLLRDPIAEITLHEVPLPCSFNLECSFWMISRNIAYEIHKRLMLHYSNEVAHTTSITYDYPVPKDIISMLYGLFKHRRFDLNDPQLGKTLQDTGNVTFANWLDKKSVARFVTTMSRTKKYKELVISKWIDNALYTVDFDTGKPDENKVGGVPETYNVTFNVKFQFEEASAHILKYPCIVDNTLLPASMIPQVRANDTPIRSIQPRYANPMLDDAFQMIRKWNNQEEAIQCPFYDDWKNPWNNLSARSYQPFLISLYTAETESKLASIDLDGVIFGDTKLHDIVKFVLKEQKDESFKDDCIFNISSYLRNKLQASSDMRLSPELVLTIKAGDIHPQRHLVISEITDMRFLNPKWWWIIEKFPDFFKPKDQIKSWIDNDLTPGSGGNNGSNRSFRILNACIIPRRPTGRIS